MFLACSLGFAARTVGNDETTSARSKRNPDAIEPFFMTVHSNRDLPLGFTMGTPARPMVNNTTIGVSISEHLLINPADTRASRVEIVVQIMILLAVSCAGLLTMTPNGKSRPMKRHCLELVSKLLLMRNRARSPWAKAAGAKALQACWCTSRTLFADNADPRTSQPIAAGSSFETSSIDFLNSSCRYCDL